MRKLILTEWISLDGFVAGPNNDMSFVGMFFNEEMGNYEYNLVSGGDTLVLGRATYESFAGSWPDVPDNPNVSEEEKKYARVLNSMKKIVFSKTLDKVEWSGAELYREIVPEEIQKMKETEGKDMIIYGSASVVQQLTNMKLIDEYQLLVHPIVLGNGKPLFKDIKEKMMMELVDTVNHETGVVRMTYRLKK